ncbi:amidohydrolase family protein [Pseudorhodoplanes sp.]|uniref:amidohydrolase family protein n=1 Tax=Pseudorhodoplanes sp. TaxID=1934341 RepID=UPI002CC1F0F5|nr:amidohydrolase family protein [Pseudorhodoplanes sp.]HWV55387.1 amidohydrolase family protein [Pseudorhodoplanes sp.]
MTEYIDAWTHILPRRYFARLETLGSASGRLKRWLTLRSLFDLDERFRIMDQFSGYRQFLTPSLPPIEDLADGDAATDLARLMNDELVELVAAHPDRFAGWCGALSLLDPDAAVKEIHRLAEMGSAGVQIITSVRGTPLDEPRFAPIFDTVAEYGMSIWLHPARAPTVPDYPTETLSKFEIWWAFGWPYESSAAMARLVFSGLFDRHPRLRIVTHHLGAMIPFFAGRIAQGWGKQMGTRTPDSDAHLLPPPLKRAPSDYFKLFYGDTALSGSAAATRCGLDFFGNDQVMFGTDFPYDAEGGAILVRETLRALDELALPATVRTKIDRDNLLAFAARAP